jgi:hypothetical protein
MLVSAGIRCVRGYGMGHTWGRSTAVGTTVIARDHAEQLREGLLIALLLALAHARPHGVRAQGRIGEDEGGRVRSGYPGRRNAEGQKESSRSISCRT